MKTLAAIIGIGLLAGVAKGYVYSYPDVISLNDQDGQLISPIKTGPAGPPNISSTGSIATLSSSITSIFGNTPDANAGDVGAADFEHAPAPLGGVVVDSLPTQFNLFSNATPLSPGDTIGPNSLWASGGFIGGYQSPEFTIGDPAFLTSNGAYAGIRFIDNNSQFHYGWLLVRYVQPAGTDFGTIELMEAAYETDPGVPITIAPEPSAAAILGVLSIGAAIRRGRRGWEHEKMQNAEC